MTPRTFSQYVQTLETWEQFVLTSVQLHCLPFELLARLRRLPPTVSLLAVSDGSIQNSRPTFGWVLGTSQGMVYATHLGVGSGEATSHRAEGWGMLSVAMLVYHLLWFTQESRELQPLSIPIHFLSDNSGLVRRVTQRLKYVVNYPNATLAPDWDIIEQIIFTFSRLSLTDIRVQWVQGHQDDITTTLSVEARFNIRADSLAKRAATLLPFTPGDPVFLPAAKCILRVGHTPISGHYNRVIREAYTLPSYKTYVARRRGWDTSQSEKVAWTIFQQAVSTFHCTSKVQLVKLIHDKLPTNSELSKSNPLQSASCHNCKSRETFHHLLQCQNSSAQRFRHEATKDVTQYMLGKSLPVAFQTELLTCLQHCFQDPTPRTAYPCYSPLHDQFQLGHPAFLTGFYAVSWLQSLSRHLPESTAIDILASITKRLWRLQFDFWESHPKEQFQNLQGPNSAIQDKRHQYAQRIRYLHSQRDQWLPRHQ